MIASVSHTEAIALVLLHLMVGELDQTHSQGFYLMVNPIIARFELSHTKM